MRGRMALHVSGLDYEHREVLLRDKPKDMLDASPKGTVPVFILGDGTVIDESLNLMAYTLEHNDPMGWMDGDDAEMEHLIHINDHKFKTHLDRYKYASRYKDDAKRGDVDLGHREQAETYIRSYEDRLQKGKYLLGSKQSLADIAIFPFMRQFANTDRTWWDSAPYPATHGWLERHINSDLFKAIMVKHPVWKAE